METLRPRSGFASEASLSSRNGPATPPYTPAKNKRRLERSDSPASSIHPAETSSPAKKLLKRANGDTIRVEELNDSDMGYLTDMELVYPEELEELDADTDDQHHEADAEDSDSGISGRFSKLHCDERKEEAEMAKKRRERRLSRRTSSRLFKRSHSQSVKSESDVTDTDALDDQDVEASARRLRRKVRGPVDGFKMVFQDIRSSPEPGSVSGSAGEGRREVDRKKSSFYAKLAGEQATRNADAMELE